MFPCRRYISRKKIKIENPGHLFRVHYISNFISKFHENWRNFKLFKDYNSSQDT